MDPIKDIIHNVIGQMSKSKATGGLDINGIWQRISGGTGSRAMDLKEGTLTVHVDSAMRMVRLNLKKELLLEQMKKDFPTIERIYLRVARI